MTLSERFVNILRFGLRLSLFNIFFYPLAKTYFPLYLIYNLGLITCLINVPAGFYMMSIIDEAGWHFGFRLPKKDKLF